LRYSFFLSMLRLRPTPTLLPYTTLFRSLVSSPSIQLRAPVVSAAGHSRCPEPSPHAPCSKPGRTASAHHARSRKSASPPGTPGRSEEHTSELQSRENLVCRLLLEKKNNQ